METTLTFRGLAKKAEVPSAEVESTLLVERDIPCVIKSRLDRETVVVATPSGLKLTRRYNTYKSDLELEVPQIEEVSNENANVVRKKQIITLAIMDKIRCLRKLPKSRKKNVKGPMKISFSTEELSLYLKLVLDATHEFSYSLNV